MREPSDKTKVLFWKKFAVGAENECWEWQAGRIPTGYGHFWMNGRHEMAHRVSYFLHKGKFRERLLIMHKCDNPPCVNPNHLVTGTSSDNMLDSILKGRKPTGEDAPRPVYKLKNSDVVEIRSLGAGGATHSSLAQKFNVSKSLITNILNRKIWRWI